jgi:hypothetical protein
MFWLRSKLLWTSSSADVISGAYVANDAASQEPPDRPEMYATAGRKAVPAARASGLRGSRPQSWPAPEMRARRPPPLYARPMTGAAVERFETEEAESFEFAEPDSMRAGRLRSATVRWIEDR